MSYGKRKNESWLLREVWDLWRVGKGSQPLILGVNEVLFSMLLYLSIGFKRLAVLLFSKTNHIKAQVFLDGAPSWSFQYFCGAFGPTDGYNNLRYVVDTSREEGMIEGVELIAKKMKQEGEPITKIMKYTNLTKEQIDTL